MTLRLPPMGANMATPPPVLTTPPHKLTWLITGCSSGLGLALARHVQAAGHRVLATSRSPSRTPALGAEVSRRGGRWLSLDVDDPDCGRVVADLETDEGGGERIDVLVLNSAGYCSVHGAAGALSDADVRAQMETVFFGPCRLVRAALPAMRRRRFGVVVNISAAAALDGLDGMGAYAAAKAAMDAMCEVLAQEVAPFNIRMLTVHLGTLNTTMNADSRVAEDAPIDDICKDHRTDEVINGLQNDITPQGDLEKAAKVLHDVVMGEGVGKGRESETVLPLGFETTQTIKRVQERWKHTMEVFGDVANNVRLKK